MQKFTFEEAIEQIVCEDGRYPPEAYYFVREALDDSVQLFKKPAEGPARHVTGPELLDAFRRRALAQFGPMALRVFQTWGLHRTEDVGDIVFALVEFGVLGKTSDDRREDFAAGYSFDEAFLVPFLPAAARQKASRPPDIHPLGENDDERNANT